MKGLLAGYERQLYILIRSGEYDDELINELDISFIKELRQELSGLPYPPLYLGDDEIKVETFRRTIFATTTQIRSSIPGK